MSDFLCKFYEEDFIPQFFWPVPNLINCILCYCGYSLLTSYFHYIQLFWVRFVALMVSGKSTSSISFESITNFTVYNIGPCWFDFCVDLFLQNPFFFLAQCLSFFKLSANCDSAACFHLYLVRKFSSPMSLSCGLCARGEAVCWWWRVCVCVCVQACMCRKACPFVSAQVLMWKDVGAALRVWLLLLL